MELRVEEILKATNGILLKGDLNQIVTSASSDSRSIQNGNLFIPLQGPNFDGHNFIQDVVGKGAIGSLIQKDHEIPEISEDKIVIMVPDTLHALGDIAGFWRKKTRTNVTVITGSSGKTTTKEIVRTALSQSHNALVTEKNFNNLIGVPHTLLKLTNEHLVAIIEIGMNEKGELARLTEITDPDWGALTNIGIAHIGKLGSEEDVIEAKSEMIRGLRPDAEIIYNADCPKSKIAIDKYSAGRVLLTFGMKNSADVWASDIKLIPGEGGHYFTLNFGDKKVNTELHAFGNFNIYNALCAAVILSRIGLSPEEIAEGIAHFRPSSMRSQIININDIKIVLDCYNSNPTSLLASSESFCEIEKIGKRYILMGDMLELGENEKKYHSECGEKLSAMDFDGIFTFGERSKSAYETITKSGKYTEWFDSHKKTAEFLMSILKPGDALFIKGSRLVKLETVYELLKAQLEPAGLAN